MKHAVAVLLVAILAALSGCASSAPARQASRPFDDVRRLTVVVSGESQFAALFVSGQASKPMSGPSSPLKALSLFA